MTENIDAERERAAFEAWHRAEFPDVEFELLLGAYAVTSFTPRPHGSFAINERWAAWQAGRRTPSASIGEDGLPELPPQPEELRARWKCENCDGRGHDGEMHWQDHFQPPEPAMCGTCNGAGWVECAALLPEQATEYARDAIASDRRAREAIDTLNDPPWGQPDLYSRLNTALTKELELAKEFGKVSEWFTAARGWIDYEAARSGDASPQAAQGVKTWQERVTGCGAVEGGHHGGGPRCGDEWYGGINYCPKCQAKARDAEIAELRAQFEAQSHGAMDVKDMAQARRLITQLRAHLARQSQVDEAEIYAIWDAAKAEAAMYVEGHCVDGEMHARHIMSAARPKVTAAPPLSSEQQPEKGEKK